MDDHAAELHAGLFPHFATDGFFDGLGGLDESRQSAVPVRGPALLPPQQHARRVGRDDRHDDGGVGAREAEVRDAGAGGAGGARGRGRCDGAADGGLEAGEVAGRAGALRAAVDGEGRLPALRAERVARVPVEEGACLRVGGGVGGGE